MPRVMSLNKGSKRRLRAIRWTLGEKIAAAAVSLFLVVFCIVVALWTAYHFSDNSPEPRLELRR